MENLTIEQAKQLIDADAVLKNQNSTLIQKNKAIKLLRSFGVKIEYLEEVKEKPTLTKDKASDNLSATDTGLNLLNIQAFSDKELKKKIDHPISRQQINSVVSAYKRCRSMAVELESAAKHGNVELFESLAHINRQQQENYKKIMGLYASETYLGRWMQSIHAVGPMLSATLVTEIDPEKQRGKQASHLISYAGYNPKMVWNKGEIRPFNAELKVALYLFGVSQMKHSTNPSNYYGRVILVPHLKDCWHRNLHGGYAAEANRRAGTVDKTTLSWAFYNGCLNASRVRTIRELARKGVNEDGVILTPAQVSANTFKLFKAAVGAPGSGTPMLPPAHMLQRSLRFLSVAFLHHYYEIMMRYELGVSDYKHTPYIMTTMGGHDPISYMPPPHECEEYLRINPGAKLDMSKLSPQDIVAWIDKSAGYDSVFSDETNFKRPESDPYNLSDCIDSVNEREDRKEAAIKRALLEEDVQALGGKPADI